MAETVRQKKIMRTRVFGFIAIFNFIFAFGKDMNFFNGLRKKSYKRNMDLIYLYRLH